MRRQWVMQFGAALFALAALAAVPRTADAFCGSYVSGGQSDLFNNATQTVLMREGQQTVLSMQNDYEGPPEDFAMIVPTPVVLEKENVKTLDEKIFQKIDRLTAPRLVEYWEKDPCARERHYERAPTADAGKNAESDNDDVTVETEFDVGEYNVVVLSSTDSSSLETWLTNNGYNIPDDAAPYLKPYIEQGTKFFVAKVDTEKVEFTDDGRAILSPLRFHYESEQFKLPVRLGLINSSGKQDLLVNILAKNQRYQVANYPNATIPTNIEVVDKVRERFGEFYRALFKETIEQNKKDGQNPVVTEYSWNAASCDPCPGPALDASDFATLGADVLTDGSDEEIRSGFRSGWVITRLHARYGKDELGKDLVFEKAPPIVGGRERYDDKGNLERGAQPGDINNFQGRYIIRHHWDKPVLCADPEYGRWGGNPNGDGSGPSTRTAESPTSGGEVEDEQNAKTPPLPQQVEEDIDEIGIKANPPSEAERQRACSTTPFGDGGGLPVALVALIGGLGMLRLRTNSRADE